MKNVNLLVVMAIVAPLISFCPAGLLAQAKETECPVVLNEKVGEMFRQMRAGEYRRALFPDLAWEDVPSLMQLAKSEQMLSNFPSNPTSSWRQGETREGIVALWLIEGIRTGGNFPSLNCSLRVRNSRAVANQPSIHAEAVECYQKWWKEVEPQPTEESAELEPLAGTDLRWQ